MRAQMQTGHSECKTALLTVETCALCACADTRVAI